MNLGIIFKLYLKIMPKLLPLNINIAKPEGSSGTNSSL